MAATVFSFLATSEMTLGSQDVGEFNFLSAKDGQIQKPLLKDLVTLLQVRITSLN